MIREQRQEYHHDHFLLKHQHLESYYLLSKYSHLNQLAKSECVFSPIAKILVAKVGKIQLL